MKNLNKRGFTLIELLVVIAIIAVLTSVIITNIYSSRGKARDAKRISDIAQIQLALEQYFNKNGAYPASESGLVPTAALVPTYLSVIPTDPTTKSKYIYVTNASIPYYDYVLKAELENTNSATADALNGNFFNSAVTGCNPAGTGYCVGPK